MANTLWVHLQQRVVPDLLHGKCGCGREEACILDLLDSLSDAEHEGTVHEGEDDVGVIWICSDSLAQ